MSQKIASVSVRIDADTKDDAEKVFAALGITPSVAVTMFYKQVALQNAIQHPTVPVSFPALAPGNDTGTVGCCFAARHGGYQGRSYCSSGRDFCRAAGEVWP